MQSRLPAPRWVGIIQTVEGLNRMKKRTERFGLNWGIDLLPPELLVFGSPDSDWYLKRLSLWTTYTTAFPGSPACREPILGLVNLHDCMSQYLIINLLILYTHTPLTGSVSLEIPNTTYKGVSFSYAYTEDPLLFLECRYTPTKVEPWTVGNKIN